jgi:AAA ATPase domain
MLWARDEEMAAIDAQLRAAREGRGGPLRLTGEAGMGKSALLDYAERRASGMTVLRARAAEDEAALPYAALHQLLSGVLPRLERLPVPQARALGVALGLEEGAAPDPFLVAVATLTLLSDLAAERPVLCLVDDAQWADAPSLSAVAFFARRLNVDAVAPLAPPARRRPRAPACPSWPSPACLPRWRRSCRRVRRPRGGPGTGGDGARGGREPAGAD